MTDKCNIALSLRCPDWLALRVMAPEPAAEALGAILKAWDRVEEKAFAVRGEAMLLIEERNLYRYVLDEEVGEYYHSFDKWLKDALPRSWGYCRDALRVRKDCKDIPYADFSQIKRVNLEQLKKVSSGVRILPEVIQAAKSMLEKKFVAKLNQDHDQHLETRAPIAMAAAEVTEKFEQAIELAIALYGCKSRGEAIECVANDFLLGHSQDIGQEETA